MAAALIIEKLTKIYANGLQALKGIDLHIEAGDFFALLGPNGAGKTTAIGILCSLVKKTEGKVTIFGHDLDTDLENAKACLGIVPQEMNFNPFENIFQILVNQAGYYGVPRKVAKERAVKYLKKLGLWEKRTVAVFHLSGGMKRRLMIARALMNEPKLLILDEPTAGVDIELRHDLWRYLIELNQQGTTIILTTHYLEEAEHLCKQIAIIDHGKIIAHSDMRSFVNQLPVETLLIELETPLLEKPHFENYPYRILDASTLEVDLPKGHTVNNLFELFNQQGIVVSSIRQKTNRLEELFVRLVKRID